MGTPYVGEIRMFAGNFAPVGCALPWSLSARRCCSALPVAAGIAWSADSGQKLSDYGDCCQHNGAGQRAGDFKCAVMCSRTMVNY